MEKKKYNLRSKKADTTQVSFDLHLSDDNEVMTNLLGQKPQVMSHQDSDSTLSGSELECDKIIHSSDSEGAGPSGRSFKCLHVETNFITAYCHQ